MLFEIELAFLFQKPASVFFFFFKKCLFFYLRGSLSEVSRTVTVHCACQTAAAGRCSARLCVWGRRDDLGTPTSVSLNASSQHHKYVVDTRRTKWTTWALISRLCGFDLRVSCVSPQDRQVSDLAQDLANKLGLKVRKAYISPQTESTATEGENHGETSPPTGEVCGRRFNLWSKTADSSYLEK